MKKLKSFLVLLAFITGLTTLVFMLNDIYHNEKPIDLTNIVLEDKIFEYDGEMHKLEISGELPEGAVVVYENNEQVNAGIYDVKSTITCEGANTLVLSAKLTINQKPIEDIKFIGQTYTYDGQIKSLSIEGDLPSGVNVNYTNNDKQDAGTYEVIAHFEDTNENKNYVLPSDMTATLQIDKADYDMSKVTFPSQTITYDGNEHELVIDGELPSGVTVSYDNNKLTNSGSVNALVKFSHTNPNYNDINSLRATLTIEKKKIEGVLFNDEIVTYDGTTHSLSIGGTPLPKGVIVTYDNNNKLNAGNYTITSHFKDTNEHKNYILPSDMSANLIILQKEITGILFDGLNVTYDGTTHSLAISGTPLPSGVEVTYTNNDKQDAGTYEVVAHLEDKNEHKNYVLPSDMTAILQIDKADYDMSKVTFPSQTITYDGNEHELVIDGELPSGVTVSYDNNKLTNSGSVNALVKFSHTNPNYNDINSLRATLTIEKKKIEGVTFEGKTTVYDKKQHSIAIGGTPLPKGVIVTYDNNNKLNAGDHIVTAHFKDTNDYKNYILPSDMTAMLIIKQKEVIIGNEYFVDKEVDFNGVNQSIEIALKLPEGVMIDHYVNNIHKDAGSYNATVVFKYEKNYCGSTEKLTATLTIKPINYNISGVNFNGIEVPYDGEIHSIAIGGTPLPMGVTVTYENNNQVNAGIHEVIAHFHHENNNYNPIPDKKANIVIKQKEITGITFSNKEVPYDNELHTLKIEGELPSGVVAHYDYEQFIYAGVYKYTVSFEDTNEFKNYVLPGDMSATLTIKQKEITGITFDNYETVYDGATHSLAIGGTPLPGGVFVGYINNNQTNADTYTVTAYFEDKNEHKNYVLPSDMTATLTIKQKEIIGIVFEDAKYKYDGSAKSIKISGTLPSGVIDKYTNNNQISIGTYEVTVHFVDTNVHKNYVLPSDMTRTLTVLGYDYDMSKVKFENKTLTYDYNSHSIEISGELPSPDIEVSYEGNNQTDVGQHEIIAHFKHSNPKYNPIPDKKAILTIEKIKIEGVIFEDKTVTYDGEIHKFEISGTPLPEGVTVKYFSNYQYLDSLISAGTYTVKAIFEDSTGIYQVPEPMVATYVIKRKMIDLPEGIFIDKTVPYNGKEQSIEITRKLPENFLGVTYLNNKLTEVGKIEATAKIRFGHNYMSLNGNYEEEVTAMFEIVPADYDMSKIVFEDTTMIYTGTEQELTIKGDLPSWITVTYEGNKRTEPGTQQATVSFTHSNSNYNPIPSITVNFTIDRPTHNIIFRQILNGEAVMEDITKPVLHLADFDESQRPSVTEVPGYIITWEEKDLTKVTGEIIVNAIYTPIEA